MCLHESWDEVVSTYEDGTPETLREAELIDTFAAELARHSRLPVEVTGLPDLACPPDDAFLVGDAFLLALLRAAPADLAARLLPRTVALFLRREETPGVLEECRLAAGVASLRYMEWRANPEAEYGGGLYGRKPVVAAMGGEWQPSGVFETPHYCYFHLDGTLPDLPAALARYLDHYADRRAASGGA